MGKDRFQVKSLNIHLETFLDSKYTNKVTIADILLENVRR
jgi:hypothetical protein